MPKKEFEDLKEIRALLNNHNESGKGIEQTIRDLKRTNIIYLSINNNAPRLGIARNHNNSSKTWFRSFFSKRINQEDYKIGTFRYPDEKIITEKIFPFFNFNQQIKQYIIDEANQNGFACAARSEVMNNCAHEAIGFQFSTDTEISLEFRKNEDGTISIFETFELPKEGYIDGNCFSSNERYMATVTAISLIREKDGIISHEMELFEIIPTDKKMCYEIFKEERQHLKHLRKYMKGTQEYGKRQKELESQVETREQEGFLNVSIERDEQNSNTQSSLGQSSGEDSEHTYEETEKKHVSKPKT